MTLDRIVFRHQNIGPFDNNGKQYLGNYDDGVTTKYYPMVLFELNSVNNLINGTFNTVCPVYQLSQLTASGRMGFTQLSGQQADGTTSATAWQLEKSPHVVSGTGYPLNNAIHAWSSIDMECWGTKNKPTKFNIMLCQFNEDVLPADLVTANAWYYDSIPSTNNNANEFWQSLIKHYSYNPLAKLEDGFGTRKMKILKQYTFNIDPTASYENDADPHVKTMKLFYRFNRKCNFQWKYANAAPQSTTDMNQPDFQQEDGENQCHVHPNARLFVMVRASNFTPIVAPASVDNTTSPSISWVMKSCYMINQ